MNFTPKTNVESVVILTIAVVGLIGWVSDVAPAPTPIVATPDAFAVQKSFQTRVPIVPAVELVPAPGLQTERPQLLSICILLVQE
jgi:hypothetical protein